MPRRQHITLLAFVGVATFLCIFFVSIFRMQPEGTRQPSFASSYTEQTGLHLAGNILHGEATAPKLENATLK
jgi:FAD-linked sulfhydryl oxidase